MVLYILSNLGILSCLPFSINLQFRKMNVWHILIKNTVVFGNLIKFQHFTILKQRLRNMTKKIVFDHLRHFSDSEKSAFSSENTFQIDCSPRILQKMVKYKRVIKEEKEIERAILGKNKHFQPGFESEMDQNEKKNERVIERE